jgi:hypothetical protein
MRSDARKSSGLVNFSRICWLFKLPTGSHFAGISLQMLEACQSFVLCRCQNSRFSAFMIKISKRDFME